MTLSIVSFDYTQFSVDQKYLIQEYYYYKSILNNCKTLLYLDWISQFWTHSLFWGLWCIVYRSLTLLASIFGERGGDVAVLLMFYFPTGWYSRAIFWYIEISLCMVLLVPLRTDMSFMRWVKVEVDWRQYNEDNIICKDGFGFLPILLFKEETLLITFILKPCL